MPASWTRRSRGCSWCSFGRRIFFERFAAVFKLGRWRTEQDARAKVSRDSATTFRTATVADEPRIERPGAEFVATLRILHVQRAED